MDNFKKHGLRISRNYGIALGLFLSAFFLVMRLAGLGHEYYLRVFNALILFMVIHQVITKYRNTLEEEQYGTFLDHFKLSIRTAFIGIASFSVFLALYLDLLDPAFMQELIDLESASPFLSPVTAAGIVFIEGLGSAVVLSYIAIQFRKKPTVELSNA